MTKKHFIALADTIRATRPTDLDATQAHYQWAETRDAIAAFCAAQNPDFNRERWLGYIAGTNGKNGGKR